MLEEEGRIGWRKYETQWVFRFGVKLAWRVGLTSSDKVLKGLSSSNRKSTQQFVSMSFLHP